MKEFDLTGFAAHLAKLSVGIAAEEHALLAAAARIVHRESRAEIGHYQDAAGMFAPWQELAQSTKDERVRLGYTENDPLFREGDLRTSIEFTVGLHEAYVGSNSPIAEYQELGTQHIPPRSFLGGAAFRKSAEVRDLLGAGFANYLVGDQVFGGRMLITE